MGGVDSEIGQVDWEVVLGIVNGDCLLLCDLIEVFVSDVE